MTASRQRRRTSTWAALTAALVGLVLAAVLVVAGVRTLADSTAGRAADGPTDITPTRRLPNTVTALVGTADDEGRLTSTVVMALEPDGTGGTIVGFAGSADAQSGNTPELQPINAVLERHGADGFREAATGITGMSFDVIEIVDPQRLAQLITPLGDLSVLVPSTLFDADTGEEWPPGETVMAAPTAARAVTATDPSMPDWFSEPARAAVWRAIAQRVGAGIGTAAPVESDEQLIAPTSLDEFMARLFAGPVVFRPMTYAVIDDERLAEELVDDLVGAFGPGSVDAAVAHDRAEVAMVLGAIAPGRLGAPLEGPRFRVLAGYSSGDLSTLPGDGVNTGDVLKVAIDRLIFARVNVLSVADMREAGVPDVTLVEVADPSVIDAVEEEYSKLLGEVDVRATDVAIDGIDIEVTLGRSFLEEVREARG
ncbi:MAG: hypothetical protein QNJ12_17430 [Ilumatobacter sp.]|uniref:hypothetical protein n=1 Tax=Ilumatobacter sp. TaxID=1967498 RepID=UPI00261267A2|nr:hypothetical protein [Ilumatobacter sp.]MDJ0770579.1 hypothetical protein [Ilumatobacter sp.]